MKNRIALEILYAIGCVAITVLVFSQCGCVSPQGNQAVPSSDIRVKTQFGDAQFILPKDQSVESLHYERTGSNIIADIKGLKSANNPDVINSSWVGVIAAMQQQTARMDMLFQMMMFSANKAGGYFGLPVTPIPGTPTNTFIPPVVVTNIVIPVPTHP